MVPEGPGRGNPDALDEWQGGVLIRLEPMDEATYRSWLELTVREYAEEKVEAGSWLAADALDRSAADFRALLPDGHATVGHQIRSMINDGGERVGYAWFVPEDRPFGRVAFIYDIAVDPEHRRRGYAQAALGEIESWARDHDCVGVQLHVFGVNTGARQLYLRAGYVETDVTMIKRVDEARA
jgi:ribosomal protein S18 acetylase RimI-like enzyme